MNHRLDPLTLVLVGWSVLMTIVGQLTLRTAMESFGDASLANIAVRAVSTPLVWAGAVMYLMSAASWLVVLSRIDLSLAYPLGSVNYILVVLASAVLLDEAVSLQRWAGVGLILLGILVIARAESSSRRRSAP